jgi:hypothetical protein
MMIDDTPLVLAPCDLVGKQVMEVWTERCIPTSLTAIPLADNSFLRGSALEVAVGAASCITIVGVWTAPGAAGGRTGTGTNYGIGATYTETGTTRQINLATPLLSIVPVWVTYSSTVLAIHLQKVPSKTQGGHVDAWQYDLELEGA